MDKNNENLENNVLFFLKTLNLLTFDFLLNHEMKITQSLETKLKLHG